MQHKNVEYFERIESYIDKFQSMQGVSPTSRQIADGTGLFPRYYMQEKNILDYGGVRNITTRHQKKIHDSSSLVPVLGSVSCGVPKFAEEYVRLPFSLLGNVDFYILRAKGDSMIEAGINSGDLVLIRQSDTAESGQIIVALIGD